MEEGRTNGFALLPRSSRKQMPFTAAHELFSVNDGWGTTFRKVPPNETKKPAIWLAGLKGVKSSGKISGFPGCSRGHHLCCCSPSFLCRNVSPTRLPPPICAQNHHDDFGRRHLRELRPVQLQLRQAGPAGAGQHAGHRGEQVQHLLQHDCSGGWVTPHRDGDAPR